jgi:plastocyanin
MRRIVLAGLVLALMGAALPVGSTERKWPDTSTITLEGAGGLSSLDAPRDVEVEVPDPIGRAEAWVPRDAGTKEWITLDYGPYVVHPGSDLGRMDVEIVGADGYAVGFRPSVVYADGSMAPSHTIHIHHAHWYWLDPQHEGNHRWIYGTGEERTQGSILPAARAEGAWDKGRRYGVKLSAGDRLGFLSMLHNKTAQTQVVFLRVKIQMIYGTQDQIKEAKDLELQNLLPVLIGSTFNVPRTGDIFDFPLDVTKKTMGPHSNYHNPISDVEVKPGVGQVFTMPWDGTIIIGAGHSHPGAKEVVLSNLGTKSDPCTGDGDRFPGVTLARSRNITRGGVFPSEEFQMGLTQPGWRVHVRKGDRLALNGVYDARKFAFSDAMSYFGLYVDRSTKTTDSEACEAELVGRPGAPQSKVIRTVPNQDWGHHALPTCKRCNKRGKRPEPGPQTNTVHIAGHQYLPGNLGSSGEPMGPPVVEKGDALRFVNEDYAAGGVRHTVTSCKAPCNGEYVANYPFADGVFESGALGYTWQETYVTARDEPTWELDTSKLDKGYYTYYCRLHAWMRGGFYVK